MLYENSHLFFANFLSLLPGRQEGALSSFSEEGCGARLKADFCRRSRLNSLKRIYPEGTPEGEGSVGPLKEKQRKPKRAVSQDQEENEKWHILLVGPEATRAAGWAMGGWT